MRKNAFTLLEVIIVIIIVGVLAALALPRFFRMVERSRALEAINQLQTIRAAVDRCYLMRGGGYNALQACLTASGSPTPSLWNTLGIENPFSAPNSHFEFGIWGSSSNIGYRLTAVRNTRDGGTTTSDCTLSWSGCGGSGVQTHPDSLGVIFFHNCNDEGITITGHCVYEGMEW